MDKLDTSDPARQAIRDDVAARLARALGPGWRATLARRLDMTDSAIRRMFTPPKGRTDAPGPALVALAEFLDAVPAARWPARWR